MKRSVKKLSILMILAFVFMATTPVTNVTFAEGCIEGVDCPSDDDKGGNGPKTPPPPKDNSLWCILFKVCSVN